MLDVVVEAVFLKLLLICFDVCFSLGAEAAAVKPACSRLLMNFMMRRYYEAKRSGRAERLLARSSIHFHGTDLGDT